MNRALALIAVLTLLLAVPVALLLGSAARPVQSKSDRFIEYLDANHVRYASVDSVLKLADTLCQLDTQGVNTEQYLQAAFSHEDAYTINNAVFNSDYCER